MLLKHCGDFKCLNGRNNGHEPPVTSGTNRIECNRSKLEVDVLSTTEGLVLSVKTLNCNKHVASFPTNEPGHVVAISELSFFPGSNESIPPHPSSLQN